MSDLAGKLYPIAFTTTRRCPAYVNAKRPTWRCKNRPTWIWMADIAEPDGRYRALWGCEEHRLALLDGVA